jgi:hypothetical protein
MLALFTTTHMLFYLKAKIILLNMIYFMFQSLKEKKSPNISQQLKAFQEKKLYVIKKIFQQHMLL